MTRTGEGFKIPKCIRTGDMSVMAMNQLGTGLT